MRNLAIVGGGITGLVAAYELSKYPGIEVDLYEASDHLGGKISTLHTGGLTIEEGPDCFFTRKSGVLELVSELGLEEELISPLPSEFAILVNAQLQRVPRGLLNLANPDRSCIQQAAFLSEEAKGQALSEKTLWTSVPNSVPSVVKSGVATADISIRDFFAAKFGPEFSRLVAEPILAGTHGGGADRLSMQALYPAYLNPTEPPTTASGPTFKSFRNGMASLIEALVAAMPPNVRIHLSSPIKDIRHLNAEHILLATPAPVSSRLLAPIDTLLGEKLEQIRHRSATIVTFAFPRKAIKADLEFTGFLVPEGESDVLTGSTWSSAKWPGRAPEDAVLIRAFIHEGVTETQALDALRPLLHIEGQPILTRSHHYINSQPQYDLGHLDLVEEIESLASVFGNLTLAGTSYRGVGIPDCIRQGQEAAKRIYFAQRGSD